MKTDVTYAQDLDSSIQRFVEADHTVELFIFDFLIVFEYDMTLKMLKFIFNRIINWPLYTTLSFLAYYTIIFINFSNNNA